MKRKIVNDPVHGFMNLPEGLSFELMEHPYMQRLRRIKQLGLSHLVYPGAMHTRFHHALGATHLMYQAIDTLRMKGHAISKEEEEAAVIAILLHDIGHGPFSHALEYSIVSNTCHEQISTCFFDRLNHQYHGELSMAKAIFDDQYSKKFLHQLVSGQIDVDRLDYLKRDSFFTGVSEGSIATDRIINMLELRNDQLAVEEKGIYSVENFLAARRLMYWQVYLHKTVVSADYLLTSVLKRAKFLSLREENLFATPELQFFLRKNYSIEDFYENPEILNNFARLDDFDIFSAIKQWGKHPDKILSYLSNSLINRNIFAIELRNEPFSDEEYFSIFEKIKTHFSVNDDEVSYFLFRAGVANKMYDTASENIFILQKNDDIADVAEFSGHPNFGSIDKPVVKYALAYPKILRKK
jgi:HD superfamily phosphohydrolase